MLPPHHPKSNPNMQSRNVAIVVFDDVEVLDFAGPFEVFNVASEKTARR